MPQKDLLNNDFTEIETEVFELYERLKTLAARNDLAPCVAANVRFALAALAQTVTDLNLAYEHLFDIDA